MSKLDTPEAQELLKEADVKPEDLRGLRRRPTSFTRRYLPLFYRKEQRENAGVVMRGLLSDCRRKNCERIAFREGRNRK